MIFVTVGTHEQPFNRLIQYVDELKRDEIIQDEIIIQTGFSTYEPKYCRWNHLFPYKEMMKNVAIARIIITHGGPASFIMPLQVGKIPVVVPRQYIFKEHINNHQVDFVKAVSERIGNIIAVYKIEDLKKVLIDYNVIASSMALSLDSNNAVFNSKLEKMVEGMNLQ